MKNAPITTTDIDGCASKHIKNLRATGHGLTPSRSGGVMVTFPDEPTPETEAALCSLNAAARECRPLMAAIRRMLMN